MTRKDFIAKSLIMGIGYPFLASSLFSSCSKDDTLFPDVDHNFKGNILIIGAGAAGLAAGFLLKHLGVSFTIVEASTVFGGRLKRADHFADFPIDLGAEWIHTEPSILQDIAHNKQLEIDIINYNPQNISTWKNGKLRKHNYLRRLYSEWKFKHSTWFGFFEENIVPEIADRILYSHVVKEVVYQTGKVELVMDNNQRLTADKVLITTPLKTLQQQQINFSPVLPDEKMAAFNQITVGDGIKIFVVFKERFYPDILTFGNVFRALREEEKFVYDAAFGKNSTEHVLGLLAINEKASVYTSLDNEQAIIAHYLKELDEIFDGQASEHYIEHVIQNWSAEPYIQGAYSYAFNGNHNRIVETLTAPVMDSVYFAGEALSIDYQATVHGACQSAFESVDAMLQNS